MARKKQKPDGHVRQAEKTSVFAYAIAFIFTVMLLFLRAALFL